VSNTSKLLVTGVASGRMV